MKRNVMARYPGQTAAKLYKRVRALFLDLAVNEPLNERKAIVQWASAQTQRLLRCWDSTEELGHGKNVPNPRRARIGKST